MLLFGLSENFCIFPLPVDTILLIIRTLPVISMCTSLHQLLFKVFHVLPFTLFCAISATLTLSVLTGTSRALLLLFILYPEKFHMSWSYYPLCHQNNYCISVQHINCRKKKKRSMYISVWPSEKPYLAKVVSNMSKCGKNIYTFGMIHLPFIHQSCST